MSGTTPSGRSPASVSAVQPRTRGFVSISGSNFRIAIWIGYLGQLRGKLFGDASKSCGEKNALRGLTSGREGRDAPARQQAGFFASLALAEFAAELRRRTARADPPHRAKAVQ